jgi:ribosome maturation factor RimP
VYLSKVGRAPTFSLWTSALQANEEAKLCALLEPGVEALGFELVTVELLSKGREPLLRVYIDSPSGVTVDDCADVSNQVSGILDVEDPISGHYTLEVSSPGLDRPLVKREHFERVTGERIKVRLVRALENRRNFAGRLVAVSGEDIVMDVDGEQFTLALDNIERARLVPEFAERR